MTARPAKTSAVELAVRGQVAEIVLGRPDASNAIDLETARALASAVRRAEADSAARVVLLRGRGPRFCGGGDLAAMATAPDRQAFVAELADAAHETVRLLDALRKPVVVAVQGAAAGIGLSLVLCADVVVIGASARLVTAYTSVGLTPDGGMSWLLPRVVGQRRATELILGADPVTAENAVAWGIASEVCADSDVLTRARERAVALAVRPPEALGESRRLVRASWDRDLSEHLDAEAATVTRASGTEEAAALIAGFVGAGETRGAAR